MFLKLSNIEWFGMWSKDNLSQKDAFIRIATYGWWQNEKIYYRIHWYIHARFQEGNTIILRELYINISSIFLQRTSSFLPQVQKGALMLVVLWTTNNGLLSEWYWIRIWAYDLGVDKWHIKTQTIISMYSIISDFWSSPSLQYNKLKIYEPV